jgi:hypothetical protein
MLEAFKKADEVLLNAVRGISDLMTIPGLINVDFADVRTIMSDQGRALMGSGSSNGKKRAEDAARQAISSPLLEDVSIQGATGILINITGGPDLGIHEVNEACSLVEEAAHEDANIIFGSVVDPNIGDDVRITVIATGFDEQHQAVVPGKASGTAVQANAPRTIEAKSQITRDYPPATSRRGRGAQEIVINAPYSDEEVPVHETTMTHDVDRALAELSRDAAPNEQNVALAMGSGPAPVASYGAINTPTSRGLSEPVPLVTNVHPGLRTVFIDADTESELDVPTFLRRNVE